MYHRNEQEHAKNATVAKMRLKKLTGPHHQGLFVSHMTALNFISNTIRMKKPELKCILCLEVEVSLIHRNP